MTKGWLKRAVIGISMGVVFTAMGAVTPISSARAQTAFGLEPIQSVTEDGIPTLLSANEVTRDQELGIVVARGNVEIAHGERVMMADTLSFNQRARTLTASGNVRLIEPSGEVIFADYIEVSEDMKNGTIENLKLLLDDHTRVAAAGGRRSGGRHTEMARAVYSPCEVCKDDPTRAPLWQIKADRVVHDQKYKRIEYFNAHMEMFGVPVAYTPYFTHPDPTVERQTGLLAPSFGSKSNTGVFFRQPFYWAISRDKDLTIDPVYTRKQGIIYSGEYRQAFDSGYFDISGSLGIMEREVGEPVVQRTDVDEYRGHIYSTGLFDVDETWRAGWDVNRSTDQTYLRKLGFWRAPGNSMTSTAYIEGFRGRNYMNAAGYLFQDLRAGPRDDAPKVLPDITYSGLGEQDGLGGRWAINANTRALTRGDGPDSQRISLEGGYQRPFTTSWGLLTTAEASLRGDVYHVQQGANRDDFGRSIDDGVAGRIVPRAGVTMRYPLARHSSLGTQVIEPIVAAFASPNGGNDQDIPNDDSTVFENDDTNIFSMNRLAGLDRIETGQRAVVGVRISNYTDTGGIYDFFLAQSYKFRPDQDLKLDTRVENQRSDIVGRLVLNPSEFVNFNYRFNFDHDEDRANRNEVALFLGSDALSMDTRYLLLRDVATPDENAVEELRLQFNAKWDDFWGLSAFTVRDLLDGEGALSHGAILRYEDECFIFRGQFRRDFTRSTDVQSDDSILFNLTFKTLGEVTF